MTDATTGPLLPAEIPAVPPEGAASRPRYALAICPCGSLSRGYVLPPMRHVYTWTPDLDRAHGWESPAAIRRWLEEMPTPLLDRLRDRQLFVVEKRTTPGRIVAAWTVAEPTLAEVAEGGAA